ncbi:Transposase family tnp2 [Ceratobasidium sp. AG-Ba]|nr:Transposase family tnp2 [Ceratobasidium sp. AG-Ba]
MDSDYSKSDPDYSSDEEYSGYHTYLAANLPDNDGKILCPCGCNQCRAVRTTYEHLQKLRKARLAAGSNSNDEEGMLDVEMHENKESDLPMHYDKEEDDVPPPDAADDWQEVPTPPPSPPPLDLDADGDVSEEEDGYRNVTADDYREYDRWFAEDREEELGEFLCETITEEELDSIKMMAIRQFVYLLTLQRLGTQIASLSGIKAETYDCCVNVCHAFTGKFAEEARCSTCGEHRFDEIGRSRQNFQYIPTIARFLAMFNNPAFIEKLEYRHNYVQREGRIDDFFDSELYKNLCRKNIVVDGEDMGVKYFSGKYDITTAVLTDGVQIFKQETHSCWPVMLQILNLPPCEWSQVRNVIPLCVIPGPNQPKDFNSFLEPFVLECLTFARGVKAYNSRTGRNFILQHHPVLVGGDMQAIKHLEEMKGVGAKVPCRGCESVAIYHLAKRTYYIPLAAPLSPDNPARTTDAYDLLGLPNRTEKKMKRQLQRMQNASTPSEFEDLAKHYSMCGPTILDRVPSLQRPTLYPHEFLHLFLLNHIPDLITLWIGKHSTVKTAGCEDYLISTADWEAIGRETEAATKHIPSFFYSKITKYSKRVAPLLRRILVFLGTLYWPYCPSRAATKEFENTTKRIKQLRTEIAGYVERYEEYYYQYNYNRICVCKLTVHALLHVAEEVIRCGPIWVTWSYLTERYCREIIACARQRAVPSATVMKYVLQMAQLTSVSMRFHEVRKALLFGGSDVPVDTSAMERVYADYPNTILRFPRLPGFRMQPNMRKRAAAFLRTNVNLRQDFDAWMEYLPEHCERWGKVRLGEGGDCIRYACARNPSSAQGNRDNSFVKFEYEQDRNRYNGRDADMVKKIGCGRLDCILALTLPPNPDFGVASPQLHVLAQITVAKDAEGDASVELVSYTKFGKTIILDVTSIKCAVGRIETKAKNRRGEWVIIDRDDSLCRTAFTQDEQDYEGDD